MPTTIPFPNAANHTLRRCAMALAIVLLPIATAKLHAAVVFSALQDGIWSLYRQSEPGAVPRPVPVQSIRGDKGAPRLSPDGARIAFEVTGTGLYVCPVDGAGDCRSISVVQGYPVRPAWHPLTGDLVFVHFTFKADEELSTIELASDGLAKVTPVIGQTGIQDFPDLSPDGRRLVYTSWLTVMPYRGAVSVVQQLWTLDLGRGRAGQLLLSNASDIHPRWSPDSGRLAFSSNRTGRYEIWVVGADGSDPWQVTDGPGEKTWPVWSPDGSRILFSQTQQGRSGLSTVVVGSGEIEPYAPFGPNSDIQIKDADWRAAAD